jgi:hypothetical protein
MPEIIVISDDDDTLTGIPDQPAALSTQFTGTALQQEPVIAPANLHPAAPVSQYSDVMIAAPNPYLQFVADFPPGTSLLLEPAIAVASLIAHVPLQQFSDEVVTAHDSHSSDVTAADIKAAGPTGSRHAMHAYFAQFAGCRNSELEVVPVAPVDADLLDLRRALPPIQWPPQFLDLEAEHVDAFLGDSSGRSMDSFSGSNSLDSFIDDAPVDLSAEDVANMALFVAEVLPITAEVLRLPAMSPATVAASKRRRWVVSSSSSSPPHPLLQNGTRRRVVASSSSSPPAQAPREEYD